MIDLSQRIQKKLEKALEEERKMKEEERKMKEEERNMKEEAQRKVAELEENNERLKFLTELQKKSRL